VAVEARIFWLYPIRLPEKTYPPLLYLKDSPVVASAVAWVPQRRNTMATPSQLAEALFPKYEFVIKRAKDKQFYWILHNTRGNTEPIAISEMYVAKQSCQESIATVRRVAAGAGIADESGTTLLG
jgi:uncharacterized protein YegP (UPF0339 family)